MKRIAAIVGLGGVGKTEMVIKFVAMYKELFPNVVWINAETKESTLTSFLGLAKDLGINTMDTELADLVHKVYCKISGSGCGRVLLIFDNAIQLNSRGPGAFGISNYLPSESMFNQRFPYILLTTQTPYWETGIKTFQIDALTKEESLDFYRSKFQLTAPVCDEELKMLHKILGGYPLAMNLVAARIDYDYNPEKDKIEHLKRQILSYIDEFKILHVPISPASSTDYDKTLSNVWQLTFYRIQKEEGGRDALVLLQLMSFLHAPFWSGSVVDMLVHSLDFSQLSRKELLEPRLKGLLRILDRFNVVKILYVSLDYEKRFICRLGIHGLVQVVVRQQMSSNEIFECVLFCFARHYKYRQFNKPALEEAILTLKLSQKALTYVGVLACHGFPAARQIVRTRKPTEAAAAIIWRLYSLERERTTLSDNAIQVLRELIELTRSGEHGVDDRCFFGDIAIELLTNEDYFEYSRADGTEVPGYFDLDSLNGLEGPIAELILDDSKTFNWAEHSNCNYCSEKGRYPKDKLLSAITAKLSKTFALSDSKLTVTVDDIAKTWFALFARLRRDDYPELICEFWRETREAFQSPDKETQSRMGTLRTCLRNLGLGRKLNDMLDSPGFRFELMAVHIDGVDFRDQRDQQVLGPLRDMLAFIGQEDTSEGHWEVPHN